MRFDAFKKWKTFFLADRILSAMLLLTIVFLFAILFSVVIPNRDLAQYNVNAGGTVPIGELYDGLTLEMNYRSSESGLLGMSFTVATYGRSLSAGTLHISLLDNAEREIYSKEFEANSIADNSVIDISFPEQSDSANKEYAVRFSTSGIDKDNAVTFWANAEKLDNMSVFMNEKAQTNSLVLSVMYNSVSYRYTWEFLLLFNVFFVLTIVAYARNRDKKTV